MRLKPADPPDEVLLRIVWEVLKESPLIDGHNDTPRQLRVRVDNNLDGLNFAESTRDLTPPMHTDLPRLRAGGVGGQFWSAFVPTDIQGASAAEATMEQIQLIHDLVNHYPDDLEMALTADDVIRVHRQGKIASLIGVEGGHSINNSLDVLRQMYQAGARYLTLTHLTNSDWADAATDSPEHNGLTAFGGEVIAELNRLGMLVDLSHVSPATMNDALDITRAPVVFTHSSAKALCEHPRNVPDNVLKRVKENQGLVMVTFVPSFIFKEVWEYHKAYESEEVRLQERYPSDSSAVEAGLATWCEAHPMNNATLAQVADHIDHVRDVAGIDHVGIGADFDGIKFVPTGLEDVSTYPALLVELLRRGYSTEDLKKVAGLNLLRVMRKAEETAASLQ